MVWKKLIVGALSSALLLSVSACGTTVEKGAPKQNEVFANEGFDAGSGSVSDGLKKFADRAVSVAGDDTVTEDVQDDAPYDVWQGEYFDDDGNVGMVIISSDAGYDVSIALYRLTTLDGIGTSNGDTLLFSGTDAEGNAIQGEIRKVDNGVNIMFTESTWEYIENGDSFTFSSEYESRF